MIKYLDRGVQGKQNCFLFSTPKILHNQSRKKNFYREIPKYINLYLQLINILYFQELWAVYRQSQQSSKVVLTFALCNKSTQQTNVQVLYRGGTLSKKNAPSQIGPLCKALAPKAIHYVNAKY